MRPPPPHPVVATSLAVLIKTIVGKEDKPNVGSISNKLHFGADVYKDISKYITLFHLKDLLIVIIFQCWMSFILLKMVLFKILMQWKNLYKNIFDKLKIQINEHRMLICDPPLNTVENKYSIAELLLKKFEAQCKNKLTTVFSKEKHFFF